MPSVFLGDYYAGGNHEKKKWCSLGPNGLPSGESYLMVGGWVLEPLRIAIRDVIGNPSAPDTRPLNMSGLAQSLWPDGFFEQWCFVQGPENHNIVYEGREERVARLGDPADPRS